MQFNRSSLSLLASAALLSLGGCGGHDLELDPTGGVNITRSSCPAVAVPAYTGDITLFDPPSSLDAKAIDVVANLTDVRAACTDQGDDILVSATFQVSARRSRASGARQVVLPYFATVVRGGRVVISKRVGRIALDFADGQLRATTPGTASATVNRAAATLPDAVRTQITRKRKAKDPDASIDPMTDPTVRAAVARASFELLIGFQLGNAQLQYNATR